jgi:exoribonuclease-2
MQALAFPLRRYTDLVNQWQIIACAKHGATAAFAAPFKPKDAQMFAIISAFDAAYTAYNSYQSGMERFWTLQYLKQENITELLASLVKEMAGGSWMVRADELPLVFNVMGASGMQRGDKVRVQLGNMDTMALDVNGTVIEKIENTDTALDANEVNLDDALDELEETVTGPIALAMNVDEAPIEEPSSS